MNDFALAVCQRPVRARRPKSGFGERRVDHRLRMPAGLSKLEHEPLNPVCDIHAAMLCSTERRVIRLALSHQLKRDAVNARGATRILREREIDDGPTNGAVSISKWMVQMDGRSQTTSEQ